MYSIIYVLPWLLGHMRGCDRAVRKIFEVGFEPKKFGIGISGALGAFTSILFSRIT